MPHRKGLLRPRHLLDGLRVAGVRRAVVGSVVVVVLALSVSARAQLDVAPGAPGGRDGAKPVFLVADVIVGEGVPIEKDAARDVLATRFGRLKDKLEVRSMAEAKASIDAVAMGQLMGSGDDADLARLETYMQVDRLVIGSVKQVAGVIDVQVKVFNMKEGVTEVAFARRMGKGADRSLVLTLLDTLADSLLAWTIENYTDGSMSTEASTMANKKLGGKPAPALTSSSSSSSPSPWSALGVVGGFVAGAGASVATAGVVLLTTPTDPDDGPLAFGLAAGGAGAVVAGVALVAIDVINGPPDEQADE